MTAAPTKILKALVAEDEPAMLSLVSRHLRNLGFSVVEASEGDMAWSLALEHQPDLILLDVMMPGMSGWEVCKRLKGSSADGTFDKTAVIMLTGIGETLNDMTSPLFAADGWLNKPFDFGDLDAKIAETLSQYGNAMPTRGDAEHKPAKKTATKKTAKKAATTTKKPTKKAATTTKKPTKKAATTTTKKPAKKAATTTTKKPTKKAATTTVKKPAKKSSTV